MLLVGRVLRLLGRAALVPKEMISFPVPFPVVLIPAGFVPGDAKALTFYIPVQGLFPPIELTIWQVSAGVAVIVAYILNLARIAAKLEAGAPVVRLVPSLHPYGQGIELEVHNDGGAGEFSAQAHIRSVSNITTSSRPSGGLPSYGLPWLNHTGRQVRIFGMDFEKLHLAFARHTTVSWEGHQEAVPSLVFVEFTANGIGTTLEAHWNPWMVSEPQRVNIEVDVITSPPSQRRQPWHFQVESLAAPDPRPGNGWVSALRIRELPDGWWLSEPFPDWVYAQPVTPSPNPGTVDSPTEAGQ